jgi:hypothetical protein
MFRFISKPKRSTPCWARVEGIAASPIGTPPDEKLHWVAGLYYFREKPQDIQPLNIALEVFHCAANLSYNNYVAN